MNGINLALDDHYQIVKQSIEFLRAHQLEQPSLNTVAKEVNVSPPHLQKVFSAWAGISPKRFLQVLNQRYAREALKRRHSVLETSMELGLSGPSRLHDLSIACDALTPGELATKGEGLALRFGWASCPFGYAFLAWCDRGVCELSFHDAPIVSVEAAFQKDWSGAQTTRHDEEASALTGTIFSRDLKPGSIHLLLRGTNFQVKVWEALMELPDGELASYQNLATRLSAPKATRAVGSALARNRIGYLIPCHRVIRQSGDWGNYRWGLERKLAMHLWESPN
ncbi:MAG: methylated-DNA--[protein]-cysteine S-methyltransferase [Pseudomonadota bacterium]